ncbi:MAG: MBL fold metallo-hydrolase [Bacteroidales bacterium]|nr:MBL fold metallo-hydrolase [Bacteroidales bacterium]
MKLSLMLGASALLLLSACGAKSTPLETRYPVETYKTKGGHTVQVAMIHHGSIAVQFDEFFIQIDPVRNHGGATMAYEEFPKADVVLITHEHGDHLSKETIELVSKEGTRVIMNEKSTQQAGFGEVMGNGAVLELAKHVKLCAVPAYNSTPGREQMHPKGNGNGYILDLDGFLLYASGDTEDIPDMAEFPKGMDIAFLSANQPYTMTPEQCVKAAQVLKPKVLVPYHLGNTDVEKIKKDLDAAGSGSDVHLYEELR